MAKISVTLNCRMDDGRSVKQPGETVSMDEKEAASLAAMGMVVIGDRAVKAPEKPVRANNKNGREPDQSLKPTAVAGCSPPLNEGAASVGLCPPTSDAADEWINDDFNVNALDLDPDALDRAGDSSSEPNEHHEHGEGQ